MISKAKDWYSVLAFNYNQYRLILGRLIFAKLINRRIRKNEIRCVHLVWTYTWQNQKLIPNFGGFMFVLLFGRFLRENGINACIEFSSKNVNDEVADEYQEQLNLLIQKYFPTIADNHIPKAGCCNLSRDLARSRLLRNSENFPDRYLPSIIHSYSSKFNYSNIRITRQELKEVVSIPQKSLKIIWGHRLDSIDPVRNSNSLNYFPILHSLLKISNRVEIVNVGTPQLIVQLSTNFQKHSATCALCSKSNISFAIDSYFANTERILSGSLYLSDSRNGLTDFAFMSDVPSVLISPKWRYHPNRSGQSFFWKTQHYFWLDTTNTSDDILVSRLAGLARWILLGNK